MSLEATICTWKLTKKQVSPNEKLFLLSCADRAGEEGVCWPSLTRLIADTGLDRKTLINVRQSVISKNLLQYTGEYKGRTKSIPVMKLTYIQERHSINNPELTLCINEDRTSSPKSGTAKPTSSPKSGTAKQSQKRDTESLINNLSKNEPLNVVDLKVLELANRAGIREPELRYFLKTFALDAITKQLNLLCSQTGIVKPGAWLAAALKNDYAPSNTTVPQLKLASYAEWDEEQYRLDCKALEESLSDPNDWRNQLMKSAKEAS